VESDKSPEEIWTAVYAELQHRAQTCDALADSWHARADAETDRARILECLRIADQYELTREYVWWLSQQNVETLGRLMPLVVVPTSLGYTASGGARHGSQEKKGHEEKGQQEGRSA
jgi:hypothetical protein